MTDDDRLAAEALRSHGVNVHAMAWDAPDADWSRFDRVVIRSTWGYYLAVDRYADWLRKFSAADHRLWNPPDVVLGNLDKHYLSELAAKGIDIVPTVYQDAAPGLVLRELLEHHRLNEVVIKPAVSASAFGTFRASLAKADADQARFTELVESRDILIQPFMPEIVTHGEWALIFFGGEFSHAVVKQPAAGDFRVQPRLHGTATPAKPTSRLIEQARKVLSTVGRPLLYARVDGIERKGKFLLMELEINEPVLYLGLGDGAPQKFAEAIMRAPLFDA
jgi:glutathione synthase/RimK-type ligase-like ATP-grasp enzyme